MQEVTYCRWSPTLGALEDTAEHVWGTPEYLGDRDAPAVFFGVYGLPDFYALWRHRAQRWILWAGTDILHFKAGYWLDGIGDICLDPKALAAWIDKYCESWVENEIEQKALAEVGIQTRVCPSFLGNIGDFFEISYIHTTRPKVYTSVSGNEFERYGWDKVIKLARQNPDIEFHAYGNTVPYFKRNTSALNVFEHGRVPKEKMNAEIRLMQGALRLTEFDGFSEILAKSVLWGQWPVSLIKYPHILSVDELGTLKDRKEPNYRGRAYYINSVNKYPWNRNR